MDLRERRIALLFTMRTAIQRQVLHGISRFAMGLPHWHWRGALPVDSVHKTLAAWKPDGIIGSIESPEMIQLVKQLGVPSIDMSNCMANPHCARIGVDDEKIGRTAAEYFIGRGFKSFGYVDGANLWFSEVRGRSFASALKKAGFSCQTIQIPDAEKAACPSPFWVTDNSCLKAWLRKLPKPVAVFASCDLFAMIVLLCCNETGIAVPDSAAVLGVDNDEILCALARPSLSSISQPAEEIGFAAAELLEKMMRGEAPMESHRLFSPGVVVTRASTDILSIDDPDVRDAVRFIRENIRKPISVAHITQEVAISRRRLEQKFRKSLGSTPQEEIRRARVELAKQLLSQTDMAMPTIASRAGFANAARLSILFRRYVGTTPREYRHRNQFLV